MKKFMIGVACFSLLLSSCDNSLDYAQYFPEGFDKILYILDSGEKEVTVYNTGADNLYEFTVCKGGYDPTLPSEARVEVLSQDEVDEEYTVNEGIPYKIIPENTYKLLTPEVTFSSSETHQKVQLSINPEALQAAFDDPAVEEGTRWLLPVRVVSNDSVNSEKNRYTLRIASQVVTPQVGFAGSNGVQGIQTVDYAAELSLTLSPTFGLLDSGITNEWEITASGFTLNNSFVEEYNAQHNTNYQILDPSRVTLPETVTLAADEQTAAVDIAVDLSGCYGAYMIPVEIGAVDMFELAAAGKSYVPIVRVLGKRFDRTGWTAEVCSTEEAERWEHALDGDINTWWHTNFANDQGHFPHWYVLDMQEERLLTQVGVVQRREGTWGYTVVDYDIFVSSDKQNWTFAGSGKAAVGDEEFIADIKPTKGRYVRLEFPNSRRTDGCINISELYFYGVDVAE